MGESGEYWRDVRAHKKRVKKERMLRDEEKLEKQTISHETKKTAEPPRRRCYDWMVVMGDAHYAKNRSSFKTYARIKATAGGARVIGIGTVELEVERSPTDPSTHIITLENVLHIPDAICNGFSSPTSRCCQSFGEFTIGVDRPGGLGLWYGKRFVGLWRLVLAGNPQGESVLEEIKDEGVRFSLSIYLNEEEREIIGAPSATAYPTL